MAVDRMEAYRKDVESIFGEELVSVTVYGGHAADPPAERGFVTVLIVVRTLRRGALAAYRAAAPRFARAGIAYPAIFTEKFLADSADVFPIEFLGMKERRKVLSGRDVLDGLRVTEKNLRHQVEFEMKGKLLCLRRMYLAARGSRELAGLMRRTAGPIVLAARGLLLLSCPAAPLAKEEIVAALEARTGVPLPRLREILAAKDDRSLAGDAEEIFDGYSGEVERLCSAAAAPSDGKG